MSKFSVLISIYKNEKPEWFREALDSVFAQTVQPDEIVLVEDGPLTPELYSVIDHYKVKHPIFNIVMNEKNLGLGLALQKGLLACRNEAIVRMDTDDVIPVDRFEMQMAAFDQGYDVVSCWSQLYVGDLNNVIAVKTRPEHHEDIVKLAHKRSPVCHAGAVLRKSAVIKAGNYQHYHLYEDYYLWVRMILAGAKFYNVQKVLYYVRTTEEQVGRRSGWNYFKTEMSVFREFKQMGFYTTKDFIVNSAIRMVARLAPKGIRSFLIKKAWNHKEA